MRVVIDLDKVKEGLKAAQFFVHVVAATPYNSKWFEQRDTTLDAIRDALNALSVGELLEDTPHDN